MELTPAQLKTINERLFLGDYFTGDRVPNPDELRTIIAEVTTEKGWFPWLRSQQEVTVADLGRVYDWLSVKHFASAADLQRQARLFDSPARFAPYNLDGDMEIDGKLRASLAAEAENIFGTGGFSGAFGFAPTNDYQNWSLQDLVAILRVGALGREDDVFERGQALDSIFQEFEEVHSKRPTLKQQVALYLAVIHDRPIEDITMRDAITSFIQKVDSRLSRPDLATQERKRLEWERKGFERIVRK